MELDEVIKRARKLSRAYRIDDGTKFRLKNVDPGDTGDLGAEFKPKAKEALETGVAALAELQDRLYAHDRWSLLLVFQAMDAAGKDSAIKHVMSGVNPQGCQVASFKAPSTEELDHDYLWRAQRQLPERGRIGIFNRSYYEEVLVVRVHPEILGAQKLPKERRGKRVFVDRYKDIRGFERYLDRNGVIVRKFFLHVSRDEQKKRFLERIDEPSKNWKFAIGDVEERAHFDEYMQAYEDMVRHTASEEAPWYVIPADNKWFTRIVVGAAIIDALGSLDLGYPKLDAVKREELERAKKMLLSEPER